MMYYYIVAYIYFMLESWGILCFSICIIYRKSEKNHEENNIINDYAYCRMPQCIRAGG